MSAVQPPLKELDEALLRLRQAIVHRVLMRRGRSGADLLAAPMAPGESIEAYARRLSGWRKPMPDLPSVEPPRSRRQRVVAWIKVLFSRFRRP